MIPILQSFTPIAGQSARVLILGSMPGVESLRAGQYYAHPRNAFWKLMGEFFGAGAELPYAQRVQRLREADVALWDVLATCVRKGSLDSAIEQSSMSANDFNKFFTAHGRISHVFFNGATAERCFNVHVRPAFAHPGLVLTRLPSTSPAHAAMNYVKKRTAWSAVTAALAINSAAITGTHVDKHRAYRA